MEILYEPLFFKDCLTRIGAFFAGAVAIGLAVSGLLYVLGRSRPKLRNWVAMPAAIGLVVGVGIVAAFYSGTESMVRLATDWTVLEHRYCRGHRAEMRAYPLSEVTGAEYRREVRRVNDRPDRITNSLDIHISSRPSPISLPLDASSMEIDLDALARLAPDAVARYRAEN